MRKNTDKELHIFDDKYNNKYRSPLIKWFHTTMTKEEKYKLGLLSYDEYAEWQKELEAEEKPDNTPNTFWKDDTETRDNISQESYEDFLANNSIDVSNKTAVDFDSLFAEVNGAPPTPPEPDIDEILAKVNRDIHGGNTILTEEEIAAMFAAANGEN